MGAVVLCDMTRAEQSTYLLFGVTVAAHGPQVLESSPQEDYEETPKESDHGGGEESPPHPLAVAVTQHIWCERDDHVHLGHVDGRVRVEFLPVLRHYRLGGLLANPPSPPPPSQKTKRGREKKSTQLRFRRFGELRPAPPDAPAAQPC